MPTYPSDLIPNNQKDKKWILQNTQAGWEECNSVAYGRVARRATIWNNRLYAAGIQSPVLYQQKATPDNPVPPEYVNLNYKILSPAPKIVAIIKQKMISRSESMTADPIDPISSNLKNDKRYKMMATMMLQNIMAPIGAMDPSQIKPPQQFEPETPEELEIALKMPNARIQSAIFAEEAMAVLENDNNWEKDKKPQLLEDAIVDGYIGSYDYRNRNGKICCDRIDMVDAVIGYSRQRDFRNMVRGGFIKRMTIGELKVEAGDQFTEAEYKQIAACFAGKLGNSSETWGGQNIIGRSGYGDYPYDSYKIDVLKWFFKSTNNIEKVKKYNQYGRFKVVDGADFKAEDAKYKTETTAKSYEVYYKASWIIGSDFLYDAGLGEDMRREMLPDGSYSGELQLPVRFYKIADRSVIDSITPLLDQFEMIFLKIQSTLAQSRPAGLAINISKLESMQFAGRSWTPMDVLDLFNQTGNYVYSDNADMAGDTSKAFEVLPNGVGTMFVELMNLLNAVQALIQDISGLGEGVDTSAPSPESSATSVQIVANASELLIENIYEGYLNIKERTFKSMLNRLQLAVQKGEYKGYANALGENTLKLAQVNASISNCEYAIKIQARPTDKEKAVLEQRMQIALDKGTITLEDTFAVEEAMMFSIKYAQMILAWRTEKRAKGAAAAQQQSIKDNAAVQQQSLALKAQSDLQLAKEVEAEKRETMKLQHMMEMEMENLKTANLLKIKDLEGMAMITGQEHKHQNDLLIAKENNDTKIIVTDKNNDTAIEISENKPEPKKA